MQFLNERALYEEGLFRLAGNALLIKELRQSFDDKRVTDLAEVHDVHAVADVLKRCVRRGAAAAPCTD